VIFPNVLPQRTDFSVGTDGDQSHHLSLGKMGKGDVLVGDERGIVQVGIDQVLDLAVVKEIHPDNGTVLVLHPDHDKGVVLGIAVGQGTDVLQKLGLALLFPNGDKTLLVIKTVLVIVREQVFYQ